MNPQNCAKCSALPQDILMLACNHDLCTRCASDRLAFEMKKKKNPNSIVCEFCYERTPLDANSIAQLQKMIPTSKLSSKLEDSKVEKKVLAPRVNDKINSSTGKQSSIFQGIPSKKQCMQHTEEQILYFCFDCKCECICPQCVIHGKHKEHDVKTIRKAHPIVRAQIGSSIERMQNNIQGLMIKKSQIEKQIRIATQKNNSSKRQVQQAFDDLRAKLITQEKDILAKYDKITDDCLNEMEEVQRSIMAKIDSIKSYTSIIKEAEKKQDILFLNFYSRKWQQIKKEEVQPENKIPPLQLLSNEDILASITAAGEQVIKIGQSIEKPKN